MTNNCADVLLQDPQMSAFDLNVPWLLVHRKMNGRGGPFSVSECVLVT